LPKTACCALARFTCGQRGPSVASTFGYGFVAGPIVLGLVAQTRSVTAALKLIAALLVVVLAEGVGCLEIADSRRGQVAVEPNRL
jgi:hypothetical protein